MELVEKDVPGPRRDLVGYADRRPRAVWPGGAKVAVNLLVAYEEGSEYSKTLGDERNEGQGEFDYVMDSRYRDLAVESSYEYGSRLGVWRLLRLFAEYGVATTFAAAAAALERNPAVGEAIARDGHEACAHGWRWTEQWLIGSREEEREQIRAAAASIERTCARRPEGWISRYSPSVWTRELLVEEGGFVYDSDAVNDDLPYLTEVSGKPFLIVPYSMVYTDGNTIHQGHMGLADYIEYMKRGLDELRREAERGYPQMMSIGLHPRWMGQAPRVHALRELIEYALAGGDVWFARRIDIARWWLDHHEEFER